MPAAIHLLGAITFRHHDGTAAGPEAIPTSKTLDLLRLLAVAGDDSRSADYYISEIWPVSDEKRGRMSLRTALAHLRRVLGQDAVRRSGDLLKLGDVDTDIARLRACAASVEALTRVEDDPEVVRLVHTAEQSCGADMVVSGTSCEAVYAARDELREQRCRLLLDGAAAAARLGWARDSLELAQRADALISSEASCRALMTAWAALGETGRALDAFHRLRTHLDEAFGVQPSPATRALFLQVLGAELQPAMGPAVHHHTLVTQLAREIIRVAGGRRQGGVVWLHGEPGSGRGSVAGHALRLVAELAPSLGAAVEVIPELVGLDADVARRVRRAAHERRVVLVVPIRRPTGWRLTPHEAQVQVASLTRSEFHDLLRQLVQGSPTAALEERLWIITCGLAGHTCRTVSDMVRQGRLQWNSGSVDLLTDRPTDSGPAALQSA